MVAITRETIDIAMEAMQRHKEREEATIRELLGRWVSELEPEVIYEWWSDGQVVVGIGMKGDPEGRIIIEAENRPR